MVGAHEKLAKILRLGLPFTFPCASIVSTHKFQADFSVGPAIMDPLFTLEFRQIIDVGIREREKYNAGRLRVILTISVLTSAIRHVQ